MLTVKEGVRFVSSEMAMCIATMIIKELCDEYRIDCVITCGKERHTDPSKHLVGAFDFRSRDISSWGQKHQFTLDARRRLGSGFTFLFEDTDASIGRKEHFHCQYPRKGVSA